MESSLNLDGIWAGYHDGECYHGDFYISYDELFTYTGEDPEHDLVDEVKDPHYVIPEGDKEIAAIGEINGVEIVPEDEETCADVDPGSYDVAMI